MFYPFRFTYSHTDIYSLCLLCTQKVYIFAVLLIVY
nr:MAG TPA: hypothetical protein [Caudoviricetes sp.]